MLCRDRGNPTKISETPFSSTGIVGIELKFRIGLQLWGRSKFDGELKPGTADWSLTLATETRHRD